MELSDMKPSTFPKLFFCCLLPFVIQLATAAEPDLILHHGRIVTVDSAFSIASALSVSGGRIVQVATDSAVLDTRGPQTRVVDLQGRMVLPGLIDSHVHPEGACMTEFDHPIPDMESIEDVLNYIK